MAEPVTFADRRAQAIKELRTGTPDKPEKPYRRRNAAEQKAHSAIMHKLQIRRARGQAGTCLERMEGDNLLNPQHALDTRMLSADVAKGE